MDKLFEPFHIRGVEIKNRICMPPCVRYNLCGEDGCVSDENVEHYRALAKGGAGLIIQEATCVDPRGKLAHRQLGVWSDEQIPGLKRIADAIHQEGTPVFMQIHHAGVVGIEEAAMLCPSDFELVHRGMLKRGREMTTDEIREAQRAFVSAALRAAKAGYDGVELHGCHQYLVCQFYNNRVNRRTDAYGSNPSLFALETLEMVRQEVPKSFVVGIRLGAFEPTLADGISHAKELAAHGIDFINVSYGFYGEDEPSRPEAFPHKDVVFAAGEIKKDVDCAVFAVNGIKSADDARDILSRTGVDMACIGRGMLINPGWANDAGAGRDTGRCLDCAGCFWRSDSSACPGRELYRKTAATL